MDTLTRKALRAALTLFVLLTGAITTALALPARGAPPLAYQTGPSYLTEIALLDAITGVSLNLTMNNLREATPVWSPDGTFLSFASNRDGGDMDLYRMDPRTRAVQLVQDTTQEGSALVWSPEGEYAAYLDGRGTYINVILLRPDGTRRAVTRDGIVASPPVWSPDGTRIAYINAHQNVPDVYVAEVDGRTPRRLTRDAMASAPAWLGDGTQLAYSVSGEGAERQVYIVDVETGEARASFAAVGAWLLAWSPDASHVAYISRDEASQDVYLAPFSAEMAPADFQPRRLTDGLIVQSLEWSGDGEWLAFTASTTQPTGLLVRQQFQSLSSARGRVASLTEVYIYRLGWAAPRRVTYNTFMDSALTFQP